MVWIIHKCQGTARVNELKRNAKVLGVYLLCCVAHVPLVLQIFADDAEGRGEGPCTIYTMREKTVLGGKSVAVETLLYLIARLTSVFPKRDRRRARSTRAVLTPPLANPAD